MLDQFLWGHSSRVCDISCSTFTFSQKKKIKNTIRVSIGLDPDQDRHFVTPDFGPNCLQILSADIAVSKERVTCSLQQAEGQTNQQTVLMLN